MDSVMIDIETLDTKPSAVILSIGAVKFDSTNKQIGDMYSVTVNIDSNLELGRTISGRTIQWWMDQSSDAQQLVFGDDGVNLRDALIGLYEFVGDDGPLVWANGITCDISILEDAFRAVKLPPPWRYNAMRDYRTIAYTIPQDVYKELRVEPRIAHSALDDAIAQALTLMAIMKHSEDESAVRKCA